MFPTVHGVVSQGGAVAADKPPDIPTDGLAVWLDAADPDTLQTTGGDVVTWANKGSLGGHAEHDGTSNAVTLQQDALNGQPVVSSSAGGTGLDGTFLGVMRNLDALTLFAVWRPVDNDGPLIYVTSTSYGTAWKVVRTSSSSTFEFGGRREFADSFVARSAGAITRDFRVLEYLSDFQADEASLLLDGVAVYDGDLGFSTGATEDADAQSIQLLGARGSSGSWNINRRSDLAELLIYHRRLSHFERASVRSALRAKWGLNERGIIHPDVLTTAALSTASGWEFEVGENNIQVNALRLRTPQGSVGEEIVDLWRVSDEQLIATANVTTTEANAWAETAITPVTLAAGQRYIVMQRHPNGTPRFIYRGGSPQFHPALTYLSTRFASGGSYPADTSGSGIRTGADVAFTVL